MSEDILQGGAVANTNGSTLEKFIEQNLINRGYDYAARKDFLASRSADKPIYSFHFLIGESIYGTHLYCDYIIYHPVKWPECLVIESKWQQSGGSVDEKYPYLVLNIKQSSPYKTIVLLDGKGYKKGSEIWLRKQTDDKLIKVFNMSEFQAYVNKGNI